MCLRWIILAYCILWRWPDPADVQAACFFMSCIWKKCIPDTVRLNLVSFHRNNHGQQLKITRLSFPLVQSTSRTLTTRNSVADHGEEEHFPEESNNLYLHHKFWAKQIISITVQQNRSHESPEEKAAESWAKLWKFSQSNQVVIQWMCNLIYAVADLEGVRGFQRNSPFRLYPNKLYGQGQD